MGRLGINEYRRRHNGRNHGAFQVSEYDSDGSMDISSISVNELTIINGGGY